MSDKRDENYKLAMKHHKFIDPEKFDLSFGIRQPVAEFRMSIDPDYRKPNKLDVECILQNILRQLAEELKPHIEYTHYCESVVTGKKYGGYYDYVPASDPICVDVWRGRISLFNEYSQMIGKLEEENSQLKALLTEVKDQRDKYARIARGFP
jgi:hypothetical protein